MESHVAPPGADLATGTGFPGARADFHEDAAPRRLVFTLLGLGGAVGAAFLAYRAAP